MVAIAQQTCRASPPCEKKSENMLVCLLDVACGASEDKVVAAIVGGLAPARRDMVEGDRPYRNLSLAVGAYGPVPVEQPLTRLVVCVATRG